MNIPEIQLSVPDSLFSVATRINPLYIVILCMHINSFLLYTIVYHYIVELHAQIVCTGVSLAVMRVVDQLSVELTLVPRAISH